MSPAQKLAPVVSPRMPTYSTRPVAAALPDVGAAALLPAVAQALVGAELGGVQRRGDVGAVAPAAADLAVHAGADLEPRGRDDHRVDQRPLDAVEDRRFVPLVDDADRHQQHAGPDVEAAREQEVEIGLLELELAGLLESLDEGVLQLELADEADAVGEPVGDEQHEAVEVELGVLVVDVVEVEVHVARQPGRRRRGRAWGRGLRVLGGDFPRDSREDADKQGQAKPGSVALKTQVLSRQNA